MTGYERHDAGTFCWVELSTSDFQAAREFYTKLFGWQAWDAPIPGGGVYTMFGLGDRYVGAGSQQMDQERSQGIPPHWNLYVLGGDVEVPVRRNALGSLLVHLLAPGPDVAVPQPEHRVHAAARNRGVPGLPSEQFRVELPGGLEVAGGELHPTERPRIVTFVPGHGEPLLV